MPAPGDPPPQPADPAATQPAETGLDVTRTWVEFVDPAEPAQRFRCDLTWLTSDYRCIYGAGCPGIEPGRPDDGCCSLGAHFTERADLDRVGAVVAVLGPDDWQLRGQAVAAGGLADGWWEQADDEPNGEPELKTRVVDGACILLNRADFAGGAGCALHRYALVNGLQPHTVKPDVCWQLPIRRAYRTVRLPDETDYLEVTIGEYDRRGWGPGGHDLAWYCTGSPLAHTGSAPLYATAEPELRELMGDAAYAVLAEHAAAHLLLATAAAAAPGGRALLPLLVHPATLAARG
ncbi:MAG: hypothetical protein LCH98_05760 [Actinobacteria bacterium]|nr:hypothetical protein [Actinomycetota bacterium]